jgi:hydrogenase maturation protein HypF
MRERRAIVVRGIVQGIGFRPFIYNLATRHHLGGFVKNRAGSVHIEVEGDTPALDQFFEELSRRPPPLAQIEHLSWEPRSIANVRQFVIEPSDSAAASPVFLSPDVATCADCLAELLSPADRRFGYPFLNCTNCGPRLTIILGAPYDRARTTMASFAMCPGCRAEYDNPADRRFHAQPTCCATCGPSLAALDGRGQPLAEGEPLTQFVAALRSGQIGALKGLGGYHLVCDATNAQAVAELRRRKHRDEKPFAVMVQSADAAAALCHVDDAERRLLESSRRPIVLLRKRITAQIAEEVAPRNPWLGVMLPYTPLHHLLLRRVEGMPLVMTSGNRSDEPIAYQDEDALEQLAGIADFFLTHNRPIHVRCDDSVTRILDGVELPLRRSRGYAPRPIELPLECPYPMLAVGGQLKGTFALGRGKQAFLSHHLGDLDHYEAYRAFKRDVVLYQDLFSIWPELLVHDLHPDYVTTRYAQERSSQERTELLAVQHHHAHMASCMAEHGLTRPVIGVTFDGTGFGTDGTIWGGEFLVGDYRQFHRAAHLRPVAMPGGDQAIRQPWRMALSHLLDAQIECSALVARLSPVEIRTIQTMVERRLNAPLTSSAGRLFDAVASLAGVRDSVSYEGQAAIELEWLATEVACDGAAYPFGLIDANAESESLVIDARPLIHAVVEDVKAGVEARRMARRFHTTLVAIIAAVCERIRGATGLKDVVLSGGVFLNALLTQETCTRLERDGFRVLRHRLVPPNDGGLSLGQLAVATALCQASVGA